MYYYPALSSERMLDHTLKIVKIVRLRSRLGLCTSNLPIPPGQVYNDHSAIFSLDLFFSVSSGVLGFLFKIWAFYSGQILEMHVVLLYFPFKNIVVSQAQCAELVASTVT